MRCGGPITRQMCVDCVESRGRRMSMNERRSSVSVFDLFFLRGGASGRIECDPRSLGQGCARSRVGWDGYSGRWYTLVHLYTRIGRDRKQATHLFKNLFTPGFVWLCCLLSLFQLVGLSGSWDRCQVSKVSTLAMYRFEDVLVVGYRNRPTMYAHCRD